MPVTGLYWLAAQTTPPLLLTLIDRLSKLHQPNYLGKWSLEHRLLRETTPAPTASSTAGTGAGSYMQWLDLSYQPHKHLLVATPSSIVTVDREFEVLVRSKLSTLWALRQTLRGEGVMYEIEDFRVRFGNVLQGEAWKGFLVEVEFLGCGYVSAAEGVIRAFVEGLGVPGGRFTFGVGTGADGEWTVLDTGRQYCEVLRMGWGGKGVDG